MSHPLDYQTGADSVSFTSVPAGEINTESRYPEPCFFVYLPAFRLGIPPRQTRIPLYSIILYDRNIKGAGIFPALNRINQLIVCPKEVLVAVPDLADYLTNHAQAAFRSSGAPGLALGIARRGELLYAGGQGVRDAEQGLACTPDTLFRLGSITKVFTAVAVMQLADQGRLRTEDPVRRYLPEFRLGAGTGTDRITIAHLLSHTSGLPATAGLFAAAKAGGADLFDYLAAMEQPLLGAPGTHFSYSNDGFALLGAIVERVSGMPYCDFVAEGILRPAGMLRTSWAPPSGDELAIPYRHGPDGRPVPSRESWYSSTYCPAGFLWSSVTELLRFLELFRTGGLVGRERLLTAASVATMMHPHIQCHPTMWFGFGLFLTPRYHGVTLVEHGGNSPGVSTQVTCVPEQSITAVGLTNATGVPLPQMLLEAVNGILGLPPGASRTDLATLPLPPDLLPYCGTYVSDEGRRVSVVPAETGLVVEMGSSRYATRYVGDHAFLFHWPLLGYETPIQFELDPSGRAARARVSFRTMCRANVTEE
jgi:CubicO group peptidase (beta-lactamase class C family)